MTQNEGTPCATLNDRRCLLVAQDCAPFGWGEKGLSRKVLTHLEPAIVSTPGFKDWSFGILGVCSVRMRAWVLFIIIIIISCLFHPCAWCVSLVLDGRVVVFAVSRARLTSSLRLRSGMGRLVSADPVGEKRIGRHSLFCVDSKVLMEPVSIGALGLQQFGRT